MKQYFLILIALFITGFALNTSSAGWTIRSGAPSSITDTKSPLNGASLDQTKTGGLSLGAVSVVKTMYVKGNSTTGSPTGNTTLEVEDKIGATQFCNQDGSVCFTAAEMSSLITP